MTTASEASMVIGSRGLLGSSVTRVLTKEARLVQAPTVPWDDPTATATKLRSAFADLVTKSSAWRLYWCAGSGVVGSDESHLVAEVRTFVRFLQDAEELLRRAPSPGGLFLASSAGGVYAGATPPFSELTPTRPTSAYGRAKLEMEAAALQFSRSTGIPVCIGRYSNLYGPGQAPFKRQGLVTALCRSSLLREPLSIFVPLDTSRDYLYVDDAARMTVGSLEHAIDDASPTTKILASGRTSTVATVISEVQRVSRRRVPIVLGSSEVSHSHVPVLALRSSLWPDIDALARTSLPSGIALTREALASQVRGACVRTSRL